MKAAFVLALIFSLIFESRTYKQGSPHPDEVVVFQDHIEADGSKDFEYPEPGYRSKFVVTTVEVKDSKCQTALSGSGFNNFYGEFQIKCVGNGEQMDSVVRIHGVYNGTCFEPKGLSDFESDTTQKLPRGDLEL